MRARGRLSLGRIGSTKLDDAQRADSGSEPDVESSDVQTHFYLLHSLILHKRPEHLQGTYVRPDAREVTFSSASLFRLDCLWRARADPEELDTAEHDVRAKRTKRRGGIVDGFIHAFTEIGRVEHLGDREHCYAGGGRTKGHAGQDLCIGRGTS